MNFHNSLTYQLALVTGNVPAKKQIIEAVADYASQDTLYLSFGGCRTNFFFMGIGLPILEAKPKGILKRIYLVENYSPFHTARFLQYTYSGFHPRRAFFSLDFLAPFYDEGVPYAEARELLVKSINLLKLLRLDDPVVIVADPPTKTSGRTSFFDLLYASADVIIDVK